LYAQAYNPMMFALGKGVYEQTCISCHGENGQTNAQMELIVKPRKLNQSILSEDQSYEIIKHGAHHWGAHADIMPAFKYVYDERQLRSVAHYISHQFHPKRDEKVSQLLQKSMIYSVSIEDDMLGVGKKIFTKKCAKCHGKKGDGESRYVELSKNEDDFIYPYNLRKTLLNEDEIFLYAKYGGKFWGTHKDDMPSWKRKYDDFQLRSVARYIQKRIKQPHNKE